MDGQSIFGKVKCFVGAVSWKLFLWSIGMSDREYWRTIYEQEAAQITEEGPALSHNNAMPKCEKCGRAVYINRKYNGVLLCTKCWDTRTSA